MILRGYLAVSLTASGLLLGGCGGGNKPAEEPSSEAAPSSAPSGSSEPAHPAGDASAGKSEGDANQAASSKPADDGPKPTRSPTDILTAPDVLYLFSFNDSEPKQRAEEKCTHKSGNDPKKMNACMSAEAKSFPADGHRFKQDEKGQWWWITVRQKGNHLVALHKIPVELGEETATSVTLKPVGKDKGTAPITPPAKVVVEVPNDYQIALQDPKAGRLVFQAKVGVVTE